MGHKSYDFSGYATKFNVQCTDGRTIRSSAFEDQLPDTVPLVYMHNHKDVDAVLGHADLEARKDGVYAYCTFTKGNNVSPNVEHAKAFITHGDVQSLSIYANNLVEHGPKGNQDVVHGCIREVSIVLAGANPEAKILEYGELCHADGYEHNPDNFDAIIYPGDNNGELEWGEGLLYHDGVESEDEEPISHSDDEPKEDTEMASDKTKMERVLDTLNEEQAEAVVFLLEHAQDEAISHAAMEQEAQAQAEASSKSSGDRTVGDVLKTLNEEQQKAVGFLIDQLLKQKGKKAPAAANNANDNSDEEDKTMKHHAFEGQGMAAMQTGTKSLSHADERAIWKDFMSGKYNKFSDALNAYAEHTGILAHADSYDTSVKGTTTYGFENIEWLFPEAKLLTDEPMIIDNRNEWVKNFIAKTTHFPAARVKTLYADIRNDDARAKGYATKAKLKVPEVVKLLRHSVSPTTVYKLQQFDKDDLRDITSFDPLKFIDAEMTGKLQEEVARAALIGDGRQDTDEYKIDEENIVPVMNASDLFSIKHNVNFASTATDSEIAAQMIDEAVKARKDYRGSGSTTLYTTEDWLAEMMLLKDLNQRRVYETETTLCSALRVSNIETVDLMENVTRTDAEGNVWKIFGIILNPKDYAFGYDHGSQIETFRDFEIKYNQEVILKEVRCSGCLRIPFSAIVLEYKVAA